MTPPGWSMTARWVYPVDAAPLERGVVVVKGERITAIEPHGSRTPDVDLGNVAVLPGLVNAHTHLDLSGFPKPVPFTGDFTDWLRSVIAHRRTLASEQVQDHIRAGLAESLSHGVTLLGDIAGQGLSAAVLTDAPLRAVVFHELLGLTAERAKLAETAAVEFLAAVPRTATCRPGLSPHAPYSVRRDLFHAVADLARRQHLPVAVHLAETREELQLLEMHQGPFVGFLQSVGVWEPAGLVGSPLEVVLLNKDVARVLLIHANYLDPTTLLPGATVVYCPRTHAHFGHACHPYRQMLDRGVRVALGTDSRASNPDLDLLAEARFLHQLDPDVAGSVLLRMATLSGAEALGWAEETGSLTPGKSADLVTLPLPDRDEADPHRLILESTATARDVLFRGRWVSFSPLPLGERGWG
jgi:aminodeoxyfutalosine deaminase